MPSQNRPLCCCEYLNVNQERSHILACCCNCQDLDESFESLITGKTISRHHRENCMATFFDRLRIPWRGGARQINCDIILPVVVVPFSFVLATFNLYCTIIAGIALFGLLFYLYCCIPKVTPKTKLFYYWNLTSLVLLYIIFEYFVVPFLEILLEENLALGVLILISLICVYMLKRKSQQLQNIENGFLKMEAGRNFHCNVCQIAVADGDHHNLWLNCCIGQHNQCYFIMAIISAIVALLYGSNLSLTSVCHPFTFYKTILLPDDCSDVYQQFELAISFVGALYSLVLAFILIVVLLHQLLLVSLGISFQEWKSFSFSQKLFCVCTSRPHSRGFLHNWSRVICCVRKQY